MRPKRRWGIFTWGFLEIEVNAWMRGCHGIGRERESPITEGEGGTATPVLIRRPRSWSLYWFVMSHWERRGKGEFVVDEKSYLRSRVVPRIGLQLCVLSSEISVASLLTTYSKSNETTTQACQHTSTLDAFADSVADAHPSLTRKL